MKILLFEYAMARGLDDPSLTIEGQAMLNGLIKDLNHYPVDILISKNFRPIDYLKGHPLVINEDPLEWLASVEKDYDACLPVAPEEDMILYKITRTIEEKGWQVIGSNSDAVRICSDKWETYKTLKNKVPFVSTQKIFFNQMDDEIIDFDKKMVIKPADGVSCTHVQTINSRESYLLGAKEMRKSTGLPFFLIQNCLEGTCVSVSLLSDGNKAIPLSLNLQDIVSSNSHMEYQGGKVPYSHPLKKEAYSAAVKAVESIKGLKGYVGVDMMLGDEVNILEVNSRLTTSYIALRELINLNLGQSIIESCQGKLPEDFKIDGSVLFKKEQDKIELKVII